MNFQSISDIYAVNDRARSELKDLLSQISDSDSNELAAGEKWTISQIVEHIATVNDGTFRICRKLLSAAERASAPASEKLKVSDDFVNRSVEVHSIKLEAPERVHPTGRVSIQGSLAKLDENRRQMEELRPMFEKFDSVSAMFPHPFFGEISAVEWLVMAGDHEARHTKQIRKVLEKLG